MESSPPPPSYEIEDRRLAPRIYRQLCAPGEHLLKKDTEFSRWRLRFAFSNAPNWPFANGDWTAYMSFFVKDISELMREGLYWSAQNCIPELSFFREADPNDILDSSDGGETVREYDLIDNQARWYAKVRVTSMHKATLANFRLDDLVKDKIVWCRGRSAENRLVYSWESNVPPGDNFNAIYDDMPLPGFWPWPKEKTG